jgi:hypothetical protein
MRLALALMAATVLATPLAAQDGSAAVASAPAKTEDVATLDGIIAALYGSISGPAGQERDWPRMRSLLTADARLVPTGRNQAGEGVRLSWDLETYIQRAGAQLKAGGFFESEIGRHVDRYGNIAQIFSTYDSRRTLEDEKPFMRGINSIQAWFDGTRWWISTVFWQSEGPNNPIPEQYLSEGH